MKRLTICVVGMFLTAEMACAATITQTKNFNVIPNMNGSLVFNKFNSALGSLTSIQIRLTLQTSGGQLIIDNDNTLPASGTFEFGAMGSISSTKVALLDSSHMAIPGTAGAYTSQAFTLTANAGDGMGDYDPTPTDGLLYNGGIETDNKSGFVGSFAWGDYTGSDTYNIDYSILQWLDFVGSIGGIEYAILPVNASGNVTVVYGYVPEPATIGLLAVGAIALLRKR